MEYEKEFSVNISLVVAATTEEEPAVPETVRQAFRKDGFITLQNVLTLYDVEQLNDRLERVLRGSYDRQQKPDKIPKLLKSRYQPGQFSSCSESSTYGSSYQQSERPTKPQKRKSSGALGFSGNLQNVKVVQVINIHKADKLFRSLATSRVLGKVVADLAGWECGARLAQDQVWGKPPGSPPLVFHRDSPYFMFDDPAVITVWVALDDMDAELGPLEYIKGSHLWGDGRVGSASQFFQPNGGKKLLQSAAEREGMCLEDLDTVSMAGLPAGSISIHDGRTWHGSGKNKSSDRPRRGLGLHFVPANVRFTDEAKNSKLWRPYVEKSDSSDLPEEDFPITWQPHCRIQE